MTRSRVAALVVAITLTAAACGGDGDSGSASPTSSTTDPQATTTTSMEADGTSIADVLASDPRFSRFAEFASDTKTSIPGRPSWMEVWDWRADQIGDDRDGVTIFAPTNEAFETAETAEPDIFEALAGDDSRANGFRYSVLASHYVHRLFPSSEFEAGEQAAWRGRVEMALDPPTWGGFAVVETDIEAVNGWVHAVDGVIIPDVVRRPVREAG